MFLFIFFQGPNRKKKRRKSNGEDESVSGSDILALGTASGAVLLYSVNRAELMHQLTGGHTEKIHSLCWNRDGTSLFSASADRKIVEWNALKGVMKRYFEATSLQPATNELTLGNRQSMEG